EQIFTKEQLAAAEKLEAYVLESSVFINEGGKRFVRKALPREAQLSVIYGLAAGDYDGDGKVDVLMGGNLYEAKPEVGIYDGSYGLFLKGIGDGSFTSIPAQASGIFSIGAVRNIIALRNRNKQLILFAKNNNQVQLVELDTHESK
ncbi:FG-GAP repeat domain-containing protein, partial [Rhodocytophaga aerolata]